MNRILATLLSGLSGLLVPLPAVGQNACPATLPKSDPCLTGNWVGRNTAAKRINEMMRTLGTPSHSKRVVFPTMPAALGITVWPDGYYATLPIHQQHTAQDFFRDGSVVTTVSDLTISTQTGYIWGQAGRLHFCSDDESEVNLRTEISGPDGTKAVNSSPFGGPGFTPEIVYTCTAAALRFSVLLPPPIGKIDYELFSVPADRFGVAFSERLERSLPVE